MLKDETKLQFLRRTLILQDDKKNVYNKKFMNQIL